MVESNIAEIKGSTNQEKNGQSVMCPSLAVTCIDHNSREFVFMYKCEDFWLIAHSGDGRKFQRKQIQTPKSQLGPK